MKTLIVAAFLAAVAAVAGVIAYRLSADALAMIVGVALGLAALTPTVALSLVIARRQHKEDDERLRPMPQQSQPPVVVVSGGFPAHMLASQNNVHPQQAAMIPPPPVSQPREFRMMGYESTDTIELDQDAWSS